ncbi:grasp-with-spasm system SPASM domain peptide maturase [Epilithonimonas hominis]|uniref:grasp-with-spasm system SPASM domain peptide maturase n=1 Tax=Epilithonimonas hominis TaxID=420404 RepID=UPI00289BDCFA|nr:grasp-with-spasm system SPASM domain peptide maturase [Epilithonimonas hominis]
MDIANYFYIQTNCVVVKGYLQSTICDLERNDYEILPNILSDLLSKHNGSKIELLLKEIEKKDKDIVVEFLEYLLENEYIFVSQNHCGIINEIDVEYTYHNEILNTIIDYNPLFFKKSVEEISKLNSELLQIRLFKINFFDGLLSDIEILHNTSFKYVELFFAGHLENDFILKLSEINKLINNRIKRIYVQKSQVEINEHYTFKVYEKEFTEFLTENDCGNCYSNNFNCDYDTFTISQNYNSCLYKKISIDSNGIVKNCPSFKKGFGNIKDIKGLSTIIKKKEFNKFWSIQKDNINVCKNCEFRYICTDCRVYVEDDNDIFSKPLKCNYNPFTGEFK